MSTCTVCSRQCVPMADYDRPVCHRCDDAATAVLEYAPAVIDQTPLRPLWPTLFDDLRAQLAS